MVEREDMKAVIVAAYGLGNRIARAWSLPLPMVNHWLSRMRENDPVIKIDEALRQWGSSSGQVDTVLASSFDGDVWLTVSAKSPFSPSLFKEYLVREFGGLVEIGQGSPIPFEIGDLLAQARALNERDVLLARVTPFLERNREAP